MGKNKKILVTTLKRLPEYSPSDDVWNSILSDLNKKSSIEKLSQLNIIEPPDSIWENINNELTTRERNSLLTQYEPPSVVWDNIEHDLPGRNINPFARKIIHLAKWSVAAAAIFLIGFIVFNKINSNNIGLQYTEEYIEINDLQEWYNEEQELEKVLEIICKENPLICTSTEFKIMHDELDFLDQSKNAVLDKLNKYNTNKELDLILTEIELERTKLIKEMIAKTI